MHTLFSREKVPTKDLLKIAGCAVFGIVLNGLFFLKGISLTLPINASLIMILVPIIVMVISYFLLRETIGWVRAIGLALGVLGATILITKLQPVNFGSATIAGDTFIFLNACSFGLYLVLARKLLKTYSPLTMARWLFTFGFLFVLPIGFAEFRQINWGEFTWQLYGILLFVILFPTCIAYYLYNVALKNVSPTVASSYIFIQPILTAIIAISLGKDNLTPTKLFGAALIFIGVYLVTFFKAKKKTYA